MAKCLLKQLNWNIECGDIEYFFGLPVSTPLSPVSLASVSGMAPSLTSKYEKKLTKVYCDIVTSAISVFETSLSKALNNGEIDEREFRVLQELHIKIINELAKSTARWIWKPEISYKKVLQKRKTK